MLKLDLKLAHVLRRLQAPEFVPLIDALQEALEKDYELLATAGEVDTIRRLQGEAQFVKTLLKSIAEAEATVKKLS